MNILDVSELEIRKARIRENTAKLADLTLTIGQRIQAEREILFLNERIRAAQELHDVLGHSLTLVISQLEGTRFIRDPAERAKRLDMIREELAEASGRLSASLNDSVSPAEDTPILLSRQLSDLADRCEADDRRVTLTLLGSEEPADTNTARNVYAICRECLTNSIRHGRARSIAMVIDFTSGLSVSVTDNGEGCREIREGTGLSGMRQRAEQLGGELRFSSLPGRGFSIHFTATEKMTKVIFTS